MTSQDLHNSSIRPQDGAWPFWPVVPLYPYGQRRTLRQEVVKETIWTFDQLQGILYVVAPIRMTLIKLEAGGLLVYAPVAPTPECLRLIQELVTDHGDVQYIILPTVSGIEHKVFVGPFAKHFPNAQVFVSPHQWSFPLNLPLSWLGLPLGRTQKLPTDSSQTPFAAEFDYAVLGPIDLGLGPFEEVAFFHRRSRTVLVTDIVVSVPEDPPDIVQLDPYPLLFHAKDDAFHPVADSPVARRKGWQRIALFAFYFRPSALEVISLKQTLQNAIHAGDRSKQAYFGLYPFHWQPHWQTSFTQLRQGGQLFVAPILQTLILNRAPQETLDWSYQVASWDFGQIIPCHFAAPITASPQHFRHAFQFLEQLSCQQPMQEIGDPSAHRLIAGAADRDLDLLRKIDARLIKQGITPPPKHPVKLQ